MEKRHTDIADRYGAACKCGGTILSVELDPDDVRAAVKCHSCNKVEYRRFDWTRWGHMDRAIAVKCMTIQEAFGNLVAR
jgi:hypothetical protein